MSISIFQFILVGVLVSIFACAPQTTSKEKQQIRNKNTEAISENGGEVAIDDGSKIAIPPGAVALGTEVTLQKVADDPAFAVGSESASSTVEIRAVGQDGLPIEQAAQPMTVALSIDSGLTLTAGSNDDMCVLLKTLSGKQLIWRRSLLTIDETAKKVSLQSIFFGKYKAVYCGTTSVAGFDEADTAGAVGGEQITFAMTIKPNTFPDTTHSKYCHIIARMKDDSLCSSGSDSDPSCKAFIVLGTSEGSKSESAVDLSASINQSTIVDGYQYITLLTLIDETESCALKVGSDMAESGIGNVQAMFAYAYGKAEVVNGISGVIGAGEFYNLEKVSVELGSFPNQPAFDEPTVCVDVDGEKSKTMHLVAFSEGKIGSAATRTFQAAVPSNTKIDSLLMRVGADCKTFEVDFSKADLTAGKPYEFETVIGAGQSIVAKPVKLNLVRSAASILAGKKGCVSVFIPNSSGKGSRLGKLAISFDQSSYNIFLPYLTSELHQVSGEPKYDMEVVVLNEGANCQSSEEQTSQFMQPIFLEDRPLTETISITLP
jgi:hypothetical protein